MKKLRIGGVPEHFNLPWVELADGHALEPDGIALEWHDYPSGSGAMVAALARDELDIAVLLTEGAVAGAAGGGDFAILSRYTSSPLTWGIHVPARSPIADVAELASGRFAISRHGSGSHLMVYALARREGWAGEPFEFVVVGGLDGAIDALGRGAADAFLWERSMTEPAVRAGHFRRIGDLVAPWPAFVVCATRRVLRAAPDAVARTLDAALARAAALHGDATAGARIAARYGLDRGEVRAWLERTSWPAAAGISAADVEPAVAVLQAAGIIDSDARIPLGWPD